MRSGALQRFQVSSMDKPKGIRHTFFSEINSLCFSLQYDDPPAKHGCAARIFTGR